ncbi:hypothetical protein DICPUDRAFT_91335 [Dictyostelium purpureum]|uniref:RNA recognition motif domain-containing protein n=1 Tax=Dictyostelium purpureum TaxID=5786 RepID=F0ZAU2_DICPU|nr:uncharacterized protein DICPUDRAFT_91335 [Dictyostelium purpureum]EGC38948.1 hypothetical protein DICPUDRAFT_91335 [Dictyostelium purpureum]|eukprot:XP_003284513.1 hypothetical protein DICPUDRAFT_91335 [Dictyostelium purpureum]
MSKAFYGGGLYDDIHEDEQKDDNISTKLNTQENKNSNSNSKNNGGDNSGVVKVNNKSDGVTLTPSSGVRIPPKLLQAQALRNKSQKKATTTTNKSSNITVSPSNTPTHSTTSTITPSTNINSSNSKSGSSSNNNNSDIDQQRYEQELILQQQSSTAFNTATELLSDYQDEDKIINEYDPFHPNDYEKVLKEREKLERDRQTKEEQRLQYQKELQQQHSSSSSSSSTSQQQQQSSLSVNSEQFSKTPTKILLLLNIATKKEVVPSLEEEMMEECKKFGKVNSVVIYPVLSASVPSSEEVRIFIYFDTPDSCKAAYTKLNNRYFAERRVSAYYYKEMLFFRNKLEPFA